MVVLRALALLAGAWLVVWTLLSAIRLVVLPRSTQLLFSRLLYGSLLALFRASAQHTDNYEKRDRRMALYAPLALIMTPVSWLVFVLFGYMGIFWSLGELTLFDAFILSGSSLFTLGFSLADGTLNAILIFSEATFGLGLVALVISYLPTMYSAFSERERAVTMLEVRAGSPPSATVLLGRFWRNADSAAFHPAVGDLYAEWEAWFSRLEETHTSLATLVFFRSPRAHNSWITAAGAVLDSAGLYMALFKSHNYYKAAMCVRAGYLALRHIADAYNLPYRTDPQPDDPISIARDEFERAYRELEEQGLPIDRDIDTAWAAFRGWRVNYDDTLLRLAALTMAPYAPWSSDRSQTRPRRRKRAPWWAPWRRQAAA